MQKVQVGLCSGCCNWVDGGLVDFNIDFTGQPVLDRESGTIALDPVQGLPMTHDDLQLCRACLQEACDLLNVDPERLVNVERERDKALIENDGLRELLRRRTRELEAMTTAKVGPSPQRGPGRPRKAPVGA